MTRKTVREVIVGRHTLDAIDPLAGQWDIAYDAGYRAALAYRPALHGAAHDAALVRYWRDLAARTLLPRAESRAAFDDGWREGMR